MHSLRAHCYHTFPALKLIKLGNRYPRCRLRHPYSLPTGMTPLMFAAREDNFESARIITNAFLGGFKYKPTMSFNFGSNSGSGLKVKFRLRWGCNTDACRIACAADLTGVPGFWQAKVCTFCQTPASVSAADPSAAHQPVQSERRKRAPPFPRCDPWDLQIRGDLLLGPARCRQHNSAPQLMAGANRAMPQPTRNCPHYKGLSG